MNSTDIPDSVSPGEIEIWFEFGSNYSYLSVMRIGEMANASGVRLRWKPFLLGPIFKSFGWESSPFVMQQAKGRYVWRDMERQCEKYGLSWNKPTEFPRRAVLPMRVAALGADAPWIEGFCKSVMRRNFAQDREIDTPEAVAEALTAQGLEPDTILDAAQSEANKLLLRRNTEQAMALGIFGAPTFRVGAELYWGNDRLEDAIADAKRQAPGASRGTQ